MPQHCVSVKDKIRQALIGDPTMSVAELRDQLHSQGFRISNVSIAAIRTSFLDALKLLHSIGWIEKVEVDKELRRDFKGGFFYDEPEPKKIREPRTKNESGIPKKKYRTRTWYPD